MIYFQASSPVTVTVTAWPDERPTKRAEHNELERARRMVLKTHVNSLRCTMPELRGNATLQTVVEGAIATIRGLERDAAQLTEQLQVAQSRRTRLEQAAVATRHGPVATLP